MANYTFLSAMKSIATLGPVGYSLLPGTMATLCTLPLVCCLKALQLSVTSEILVIAAITVVLFAVVRWAKLLLATVADPQQIVVDEVAGCLWAFCGIAVSFKILLVGFFLFRFFDIVKPLGIRYTERAPGAWGIMLDDILAGSYTALVLALLYS